MPDAKNWRPYRLEVGGTLRALSALHIGSGQMLHVALDAPLLRTPATQQGAGIPYIPGASIRGVLKHWLDGERSLLGVTERAFLKLFGNAPQGGAGEPGNTAMTWLGRLTVEEALLAGETLDMAEVRDHVRIDRETGAAAEAAKFDGEVLPRGAAFTFRLAYEGDGHGDPELVLMREALRLLQSGDMRIGAKSAWGYGQVQLEAVEHRIFSRNTSAGLAAWMGTRLGAASGGGSWQPGMPDLSKARPDGQPGLAAAYSCLTLRLGLHFEGPVLVRSSLPPRSDLDAFFTQTGPKGQERTYLPGSSLRGVLRNRAGWLSGVTNRRLLERLFGPELQDGEEAANRGLIEVSDGELLGNAPDVLVDHVAIDRIVGGARDGAKFNMRPLDSPSFNVSIRVRFREHEADALALWGRLLRDLLRNPGDLWVGSGTSRGYGYLHHAEVLSAELNLVEDDYPEASFAQPPRRRSGRAIYDLEKPAFADFAPLWKLVPAGTWSGGGNAA